MSGVTGTGGAGEGGCIQGGPRRLPLMPLGGAGAPEGQGQSSGARKGKYLQCRAGSSSQMFTINFKIKKKR